jgi:hypothetical protein
LANARGVGLNDDLKRDDFVPRSEDVHGAVVPNAIALASPWRRGVALHLVAVAQGPDGPNSRVKRRGAERT